MKKFVTTLAALLLPVAGCGRQNLDLIVPVDCPDFETEAACQEHSALGCRFRPNLEGCLSTDPDCPAGACRNDDPFVKRSGRQFLLNGAPFDFKGVSTWALLPAKCSPVGPDERDAWLQRAFDDLVPSGTKVLRGYAFQNAAGLNGNDFALFDNAVRMARRAGIRLIFALEHEGADCSDSAPRDAAWYTDGYKSPDGAYTLSYRQYVANVAQRYSQEPTVMGYVLVHSMGNVDHAVLGGFVSDVGQLVHDAAPNQLVSLDLRWGSGTTTSFQALEEQPQVDFIDVDDYQFGSTLEPMDSNLVNLLRKINKPAIIGEGAFVISSVTPAALQARSELARQRLTEWPASGFAGALLWAYQPGWRDPSEEFDARLEDPLLQPNSVLANAHFGY